MNTLATSIATYSVLTLVLCALYYYKSIKAYLFKIKEHSGNYSNILNLNETNMEASQKAVGFGSIWNNNSWFYEEKNFTKFAKEYLTEKLG